MIRVTASPKLAAIGVAMLSGFMLNFLAVIIMKITIDPILK